MFLCLLCIERIEKMLEIKPSTKNWNTRGEDTVKLLEAVLRPGDKVNIEGDNQKQADFLAKQLCEVDPTKVHDLHMIQSTLSIPEHLDVFEKGIAHKLDFAYAGSQGKRLAQMVQNGGVELGAIHTYLEMYSRYFIDLVPRVSLVTADAADAEGNIYTGFSTEDTPAIVEATKFNQGIVIFQVNKIVDKLPRVDMGTESASDPDSGYRNWLGTGYLLLRFRSRYGRIHQSSFRHLRYRTGRHHAFQPCIRTGSWPLCS